MTTISTIDALRNHLSRISASLGASTLPSNAPPHRLVRLSYTHLALLRTSSSPPDAHVHILPTTLSQRSVQSGGIRVPSDAHTLLPVAHDLLAVIGTRSVTVIRRPLVTHPDCCHVATSLFQQSPHVSVVHADWAPHAAGFLMLLTSDSTLRLYDVFASPQTDAERFRLRVHTPASSAAPVTFAFGRGDGWTSLALYVMLSDGAVFFVAPVAPVGTRLSTKDYNAMLADARAKVRAGRSDDVENVAAVENVDDWATRQASMQLSFLRTVFQRSGFDDMVAVREFKPAPLLFQGPLFIEHDDDAVSVDRSGANFTSLIVVNYKVSDAPPVLLRVCADGTVTILIALESVEPQWFLSTDAALLDGIIGDDGDGFVMASDEYRQCAAQVAPSLLCFEKIAFEDVGGIELVCVGAWMHADVVLVVSRVAMYAMRLSFVAAMGDVCALEGARASCAVRLFCARVAVHDDGGTGEVDGGIVGVSPHFVRGVGAVGVVLTADGGLHVTGGVRWGSGNIGGGGDGMWTVERSFLAAEPVADGIWGAERSAMGRRTYACGKIGREVGEMVESMQDNEAAVGGRVGKGVLGVVGEIAEFEEVLLEMERRVDVFAGGGDGAGMLEVMSEVGNGVVRWGMELTEKVRDLDVGCEAVGDAVARVVGLEAEVGRKVGRVAEIGVLLGERVRKLRGIVEGMVGEVGDGGEWDRGREALLERRRKVKVLKGRVGEIGGAVKMMGGESGVGDGGQGGIRYDRPLVRRTMRRAVLEEEGEEVEGIGTKDVTRIRMALEKHGAHLAQALALEAQLRKALSPSAVEVLRG